MVQYNRDGLRARSKNTGVTHYYMYFDCHIDLIGFIYFYYKFACRMSLV